MNDLQARKTACDWHGGQSSPLYALCSSGAIVNYTLISDEISDCYASIPGMDIEYDHHEEAAALDDLQAYIDHAGERGPVDGWSRLNW